MPAKRKLDERVAQNQQTGRRVESNFLEVADRGRKDHSFLRNEFVVDVTVSVWRRPIEGGLISGHPDPEHGSGRGVSGDQRGEWQLIGEEDQSVRFTRQGRRAMRDTLDGQDDNVAGVVVGDGVTIPTTTDEELVDETGRDFAWGHNEENVGYATGEFRFQDTIDPREFGVLDGDDQLVSRAVLDDLGTDSSDEIRVEFEFDIQGEGRGSSVIVDEGPEAVATAFTSRATFGLTEIAIGVGGDPDDEEGDFSETDTSLNEEVYRKGVERFIDLDGIRTRTLFHEHEPPDGEGPVNQPFEITEIGVFDNAGRMVWATSLTPEEKNEEVTLSTTVGFQFR